MSISWRGVTGRVRQLYQRHQLLLCALENENGKSPLDRPRPAPISPRTGTCHFNLTYRPPTSASQGHPRFGAPDST